MSDILEPKIGKATAWSSAAEILAKLITPLVNIILARLLTPDAFGLVATITMVISFAEIFTDAGFQKYIVQHEFSSDDELEKGTTVAFWTNLVLSCFICLIIFALRDKIAVLVGSPELGGAISVASLMIILTAFSSLQSARYKRALDFKTLFYVRMGTALIPLVVTVPLAIMLRNHWALLGGTFASNAFSAVVLTIKSKWRPRAFYSFRMLKEMFSFTAWTLLESISIWLTSYVDVFIVGALLNSYYLGLYKTSMTAVNSCMAVITSAVLPVMFSTLSRYQTDDARYQKTFFAFQRWTALFVVPMGIGIFLFSDLFTWILLGNQWTEASGFIGLWGLTSSVTLITSYFASEVYRSKGRPKVSFMLQMIHLAFLIPCLVISGQYTFAALYSVRAGVRIQSVIADFIVLALIFKISAKDVLENIFPSVVSAVIMGFTGWLLKSLSGGLMWQFAVILICICVYFAALFLLFPKVWREVVQAAPIQKILHRMKPRKG